MRICVLFALAVTVLGLDLYLVERHAATHRRNAPVEALVDRQGDLCQRMDALTERDLSRDPRAHATLVQSIQSFEQTLHALESGNVLPSRPMVESDAVAQAVREQRQAWNALKPLLVGDSLERETRVLAALGRAYRVGDGRAARAEPTERIELEAGIARLLRSSLDLVDAVESWGDGERRRLSWQVKAVSLVGLLALAGAFASVWRHVVGPLRRLRLSSIGASHLDPSEVPTNEVEAIGLAVDDMSRDLTQLRHERRRIDAELRRAEADYQSIFDNAVAGILRSDAKGKPIVVNRALARMLGYESPDEILTAVENVHEELFADDDHGSRFDRLHREHGHVELETRARRKDGSTVSVLESARIAESRGGTVYDIVIVDVTSLKTAQESLRDLSGQLLRYQDDERRRIARELHDSTGQLLAALEMNLGRLDELLPEVKSSVASSVELAEECSRQLRSTSYLLHPPMIEEMGLVHALHTFVRGFAARSGIDVALDGPKQIRRLDPDAELALFRIMQEALTNVQRHAKSPDAVIRVRESDGTICLEVEDHGRGLDASRLGDGSDGTLTNMGVGMRGMAERLRQFSGRLKIDSRPGCTIVRAELPITQVARREGPAH